MFRKSHTSRFVKPRRNQESRVWIHKLRSAAMTLLCCVITPEVPRQEMHKPPVAKHKIFYLNELIKTKRNHQGNLRRTPSTAKHLPPPPLLSVANSSLIIPSSPIPCPRSIRLLAPQNNTHMLCSAEIAAFLQRVAQGQFFPHSP